MEYDYGESIYQIIPPKIVPPIKPAMHRSKLGAPGGAR